MPTSSSPRADLHATLEALRAGRTTAEAELDESIRIASSAACDKVFLETTFDRAREALGHTAGSPLGGLAVSVKDLFDVQGEVTSAGSVVLADAPPAAADAPAVARLRAAGAAFIGRTNMSEFAFSGVGINPHYGTPANPADAAVKRVPGGSSSGAAVSVATGAAFVGLGSDTRGSIRIPAALCGVVGFKNTARLVPLDGAVPLSTTLDTVCAMTRSVRDAILVHGILAAKPPAIERKPLSQRKLAVVRTLMLDALEAPVAAAFERSLKALRDAGAAIEEIALPEISEVVPMLVAGGFAGGESYAWHHELLARAADRYDPRVRFRIEQGEAMKAWEYIELHRTRNAWIARIAQALQGFDAVLSPTVPLAAPPIERVAPGAERDEEFFRTNALLLRNTGAVNMLDGCAISIPCHAPGELPTGLMLWHGALHDDAILSLALQAESALAPVTRPA